MQQVHAFVINRSWFVSFLTVIALFCSGAALGIHYSTDSRSLKVVISGVPDAAIEGEAIHFSSTVTGSSGPYSYNWLVNSTFYSSSGNPNITFYTAGIHIISLSVSAADGYSGLDTVLIHVHSAPDVFITSDRQTVSKGENVTFRSQIIGAIGPYYYTWYANGIPIKTGFNLSNISYAFQSQGIYNISLSVNNSLGFYGSTTFNFDPWGFSESAGPAVRSGYGTNNAMANIQPQNATGNLTFHFFLYNPSSGAGEDNISVGLFPCLPPGGPNSAPLMNFTFSSGIMSGKTGKWISINPHIYWNNSSIAVIPDIQTGLSGNVIGVANPAQFNEIFSHYWVPGWDGSDDGFVGYWTVSHNVTVNVA